MAGPVDSIANLTFEDARRVVEERAATVVLPESEAVNLLDALGRTLAATLLADRDMPPFPRSTRDGFALRAADLEKLPAMLRLIGEVRAGENPGKIPAEIQHGEVVAIMTGAPIPAGADAVVMVEYSLQSDSKVEIRKSVVRGENVVPRGAEAAQGSILFERGNRIGAAAIALAASAGKQRLEVYARPRVAVLSTGGELVDIASSPGPAQIRNSNSYSLAAQIRGAGGEPILLPIAPDNLQKLTALIEHGLSADLLLITGGVSVGRYDLVERALADLGAEFFFTGAMIQPGRPIVFGRAKDRFFFGLPGNPVSTMVTFDLFVRPMLHALAGQCASKLQFLHARLKRDVQTRTGLKRFLPAVLSGEFENSIVELVPWHGSGDIAASARANCYLVVPPNRERLAAGDWAAVMILPSAM
jgi:molybdopterin molybdotransferase